MGTKTSRNAPCPCGSGKKYKKCCLGTTIGETGLDLHYRRLSKVYDKLFERLVAHAQRIFGEAGFAAAMDEFWLWPEPGREPDDERLERELPLFWPWFVFNWELDLDKGEGEFSGPQHCTVAEDYALKRGSGLESLERKIIEAVNRKPHTFWEVKRVDTGRSLDLQDVLCASRITVQERSGSTYLKPGDMVFGRAVPVDGVGMFMGLGTTIIPPIHKPGLIDLRRQIRGGRRAIVEADLLDWEFRIRSVYHNLIGHLHSPPVLSNTDGDPLEMHKLVFEIDDPDRAFELLAPLCVTDTPEELREAAEIDELGRIRRAEFPVTRKGFKITKGPDNTILGHLTIESRRLILNVNSAERARRIRRKIEKKLGAGVRFKVDEIQEMTTLMKDFREKSGGSEREEEQRALMQAPEVQALLEEMMRRHWEQWVDQPIPALRGKTPREAAKTAEGREAVAALLADAERERGGDAGMTALNRKGAGRLRKLLKIPGPEYE